MIQPSTYPLQLNEKIQRATTLMAPFSPPELQVFPSATTHYRMRAEFKMWHQHGQVHYAMFETQPIKKVVPITEFPVASQRINQLMPVLLAELNADESLRHKLFEVHFLTSTQGDALISLLYHKPLSDDWQTRAEALKNRLGVNLIGRSRGQKRIIGQDSIHQCFEVKGRSFHYRYSENSFTQPNGALCQQMLNWAANACTGLEGDLLELYCGNGNFTLPLACEFNRVLATEVSKVSAADALVNIHSNGFTNIQLVRMASEELVQALAGERTFRRLEGIALADYCFSCVFVDPPRSGLDAHTLAFIQGFNTIVYVSCCLDSLADNLQVLHTSHRLSHWALFDQFPYTQHIESGVVLQRRKP